jgi:hypothetical protein
MVAGQSCRTTVQSLRTTCAGLDIGLRGPHSSPVGRKLAFKAPVRLIEPLNLYVSAEVKARLAVEADVRGISLSALYATILAVIATNGKAILDD